MKMSSLGSSSLLLTWISLSYTIDSQKMNEEIITGKIKRWREETRKEEEGQKEE